MAPLLATPEPRGGTDSGSGSTAASAAVRRAVAYLCGRQDTAGLWNDFRTPAGASDEWVTAFVTAHLAELCAVFELPAAEAAVGHARRALLARQRADGGWGYNARIAADADSTAWAAVAVAPVAGAASRAAASGFLLAHQHADGGFATYHPNHRARLGFRDTWFEPQPCVTAAALRALGATRAEETLGAAAETAVERGRRWLRELPSEALVSCWWGESSYTVFHVARATRVPRAAEDPGATPSRPVFEQAHRLLLLALHPPAAAAAERGRPSRRLLSAQRADGSWPAAPILRIPDETAGGTPVARDVNRLFATVTAACALAVSEPCS
jgi:hypothetical protein